MRKAVKYIITPLAISTAIMSIRIDANAGEKIDITNIAEYKGTELRTIYTAFCKSDYFKGILKSAENGAKGKYSAKGKPKLEKLKDLLNGAEDETTAYDKTTKLIDLSPVQDLTGKQALLCKSLSNNTIDNLQTFKTKYQEQFADKVDKKIPATTENLANYFSDYIIPEINVDDTIIYVDQKTDQPKKPLEHLKLKYLLLEDIKNEIKSESLKDDTQIAAWQAANAEEVYKRAELEPKYIEYLKVQNINTNPTILQKMTAELGTQIKAEYIKKEATIYDYLNTKDHTALLTEEAKANIERPVKEARIQAINTLGQAILTDVSITIKPKQKIKSTESETLETLIGRDKPEEIINAYITKVKTMKTERDALFDQAHEYFTNIGIETSENPSKDMLVLLSDIGNQFALISDDTGAEEDKSKITTYETEINNLRNQVALLKKQNQDLQLKKTGLGGGSADLHLTQENQQLKGIIRHFIKDYNSGLKGEIETRWGLKGVPQIDPTDKNIKPVVQPSAGNLHK